MARPRVKLNSPGVEEILKAAGVRAFLHDRMAVALQAAQSSAPVSKPDGGAYRDSIHLEDDTTDRAVVRLVADVDYALFVEAHTGNLARALDAAGGEGGDPLELIDYVTKSGKKRKATRRQVDHWTRGGD